MNTNTTNTTTSSRYTYTAFAEEVIGVVKGEVELTPAIAERIVAKASALLAAQNSKAEYNKAHPKKSTAKGASADTSEKAKAIEAVLSDTPMTGAEINAALGADYTALQIANACKFIPGVVTSKVVRTTVNSKGLKAERQYTAYAIG